MARILSEIGSCIQNRVKMYQMNIRYLTDPWIVLGYYSTLFEVQSSMLGIRFILFFRLLFPILLIFYFV